MKSRILAALRSVFRRPEPKIIVVPQALHVPLTKEDRRAIDDWMALPTTARVLALMEARHPGLGMPGGLTRPANPHDAQHAVTYIAKVRGWEMYRNQLLALTAQPKTIQDIPENYPSE